LRNVDGSGREFVGAVRRRWVRFRGELVGGSCGVDELEEKGQAVFDSDKVALVCDFQWDDGLAVGREVPGVQSRNAGAAMAGRQKPPGHGGYVRLASFGE